MIYYHLKVRNTKRWFPARNCRVLLRKIERRNINGKFQEVPLMVPHQYAWAPRKREPQFRTVIDEDVLDFGFLPKPKDDDTKFWPAFYSWTTDFDGFVNPGECIRYHLQILSDQYVSRHFQVFEVSWDGHWTTDLEKMRQHLTIQEVTAQVPHLVGKHGGGD